MAEPLVPRIRVPHPHVRVDASVLGGSPHVNGSRVPVRRLWAWHRGGAAVETLVRRYPNLGPARILDALSFAYDNQDLIEADLEREQSLFAVQGGPIVGARPLAQLALPFDPDAAEAAVATAMEAHASADRSEIGEPPRLDAPVLPAPTVARPAPKGRAGASRRR
jgi:uncharacterized protein (DUF433 family)